MTIFVDTRAPITSWVPVTKADANMAGGTCRALWVGTPGTANLMQDDGTIRANVPLKDGLFPCAVRQVRTGGSATDIWALY